MRFYYVIGGAGSAEGIVAGEPGSTKIGLGWSDESS
jgi:hypothetical protein